MPTTPNTTTTQQFLDIYDITNDVLILKNGTSAIILTVDAMNFGLLAEEEQDAIMYAYAGLLNSLNYPIQIVVQSKTKDVTGYLRKLTEQEEKTSNETMRKRIAQYRLFVANLIHERNVLDKRFYVVIPATSIEMGFLGAQTFVPGKDDFNISDVERSVVIEKASNLLEPKRDHLISQFARIGLYSRQLNTQEIIQLFYVNYNPESTEGQEIAESSAYTSGLVHADMGTAYSDVTTATPPQNPRQQEVTGVVNPTTNVYESDSNPQPQSQSPITPAQANQEQIVWSQPQDLFHPSAQIGSQTQPATRNLAPQESIPNNTLIE
ncbi:hypothetical protein KBC89_02685 [Candidatus Woesebacteria bacterium]|nr:hypothetical protein [Candidatus Woesebacteria bacterium]